LQETDHYSQTNVPIIKTKPLVTKYKRKKNGRHRESKPIHSVIDEEIVVMANIMNLNAFTRQE